MKKRLLKIIAILKLNQKEFTKKMNVSRTTINNYLQDRSKSLSNQTLIKISETYNIDLNWLLTGTGEMFLTTDSKDQQIETLKTRIGTLESQIYKIESITKSAVAESTLAYPAPKKSPKNKKGN